MRRHTKAIAYSTILALIGFAFSAHAQMLRGKVFDAQTRQPLPYANLGVRGKSVGGITDATGAFAIDFSKATANDSVVISYVGYQSRAFALQSLAAEKNHVFYLTPTSKELAEVVILSKQEKIILGNDSRSSRHTGWGDFTSAAGRAVGLQIPPPEIPVKINTVFFHLHENEFDSVRLRINFFHVQGTGIVPLAGQQTNVFLTTRQRKGWVAVPLPEALVFDKKDLVVAIEWLDAWAKPRSLDEGGSYMFTLSLGRYEGLHYRREKPNEVVQLTPEALTPSIYLECLAIKK